MLLAGDRLINGEYGQTATETLDDGAIQGCREGLDLMVRWENGHRKQQAHIQENRLTASVRQGKVEGPQQGGPRTGRGDTQKGAGKGKAITKMGFRKRPGTRLPLAHLAGGRPSPASRIKNILAGTGLGGGPDATA